MSREYVTWRVDAEIASRFNTQTREAGQKPNEQIESLMSLWLDYIKPKLEAENGNG